MQDYETFLNKTADRYEAEVQARIADINAQNNMGWFYHQGLGVEQSYEQAAYWYRQAIAQGSGTARVNFDSLPERYR